MKTKRKSKNEGTPRLAPSTSRADERRQQIIVAAASVFAEHGYANTTMGIIADKLDYHTAGLYYYFENKDALVEALLKYTSQRLVIEAQKTLAGMPDASPLERLKAMIRSHAMTVMRKDSVGVAFQKIYKQVSPDLQSRTLDAPRSFAKLWQEVIDAAIESGDLRTDIPPRLLRLLLIGSLAWMPDWYKPKGANNPEEIANALTTLFLEGALAHAPGR